MQRLEKRRGGVAVVGEVVLGDEAVVEAERFGILYLLNALLEQDSPIPQFGIGPLVEQAEFHAVFAFPGSYLAVKPPSMMSSVPVT